ncbi:MAG: hypothetical protein IH586_10380, partial [Anaerolineaceae bacterium]|nr:hypothetical protein [Anaerolineaceae bacterium]
MTITYLPYPLAAGFVDNWLTAGPQVIPVEPASGPISLEARAALVAQMHTPRLEIAGMPVERGKLSEGVFTIGSYQGSWSYCACQEDHLVNHSGVYSPAS